MKKKYSRTYLCEICTDTWTVIGWVPKIECPKCGSPPYRRISKEQDPRGPRKPYYPN